MQELDKVDQPENVDDGDANAEVEEVHQAPRRLALDNVISPLDSSIETKSRLNQIQTEEYGGFVNFHLFY